MGIKSLEELSALRDKHRGDLVGRDASGGKGNIRVTVGMATCGIASGSRETINAIIEEVKNQKLNHVTVVQSGCLGYCYAEPTVEISEPGKEPILYGKIDTQKARELVKKHIVDGVQIKEWEIIR